MKKNTAFRESFDLRLGLTLIGVLAVGALLFAAVVAGAAAARPLVNDGQIHACYRVKGKPKGELRVIANARAHCRRTRFCAGRCQPTSHDFPLGRGATMEPRTGVEHWRSRATPQSR